MAKVYFLTAPGIAQYPHIIEPDTKGKFPTGKYSTKFVQTPEEAAPLIAQLKAVAATHKAGASCKLPYKDDTRKEGDKEVKTGLIRFSLSSKFPPLIMNAKNKRIDIEKMNDDFEIGAGSKLRIAGELFSYEKGISLQIRQVQVLDLIAGRASMFDAQDGSFDGSEYMDDDEDEDTGAFTDSNKEALGI